MFEMSQRRIVAVNYFRRWNPTLANVVDGIQRGDWGKVINITIRYTKGLFVNGSHFVDLTRWILGEPKSIDLIKITLNNPVDPGGDFSLDFDDGVTAYFINIPEIDYVFADVDILMEKGRIVIGQRGQTLSKYSVMREPHYNLFDILGNAQEIETEWRNCTTRAVQEIVDCLKNGGSTSCTIEDGYRVMEICHQLLSKKKEATD
jgi:predicted dehydrogenase